MEVFVMKRGLVLIAGTLLVIGSLALPALADTHYSDLYCDGTYTNAYVEGDVYVDYGDTCTLGDSTVAGNIEVMGGGSLYLSSSYVDGNVQAEYASLLSISSSEIMGDIQAKYTAWAEIPSSVEMNTVYGSIQMEGNWADFLVRDNCVEGNVQIKDNFGMFTVQYTVEGMQCDGGGVEGNIQTEGGSIDAVGAYVGGNVQTEGATDISIVDSEIAGDIQAKYAEWAEVPSVIEGNTVGGNVQLEHNGADFLIALNYIEGDLQLYDNYGAISVENNTVMGNLECCGGPVTLLGNIVAGSLGCYAY
jgi:hypothetical protein